MIFPARKDGFYRFVFSIAFVALLYALWESLQTKAWLSCAAISALILFLLWVWLQTKYTLTHHFVKIRMGPYERKIAIKEIHLLRKTKNVLSSFALSAKRLEIHYGKYRKITYVAPQQMELFIHMLLELNPDIAVESQQKAVNKEA